MSISALFPGMEAYLDGDVEINNNVTTPEEDAAHEVEAADQTADIATDAGEVETDVKNDDVATQMLLRTGRLYYHVKKYGVDRTFLRLYNQHDEMDRMCGIQFPSCEAMNATGNPYSRYSAAFIAAMEDEKTGFWATIWEGIQKAWKWLTTYIADLWNKILQFFGVRARDLQKLISEIEQKYDTNAEVTLAKGSKLSLAVDPANAKNPVNKLQMEDGGSNKPIDRIIVKVFNQVETELNVKNVEYASPDESLKLIDEYTKGLTEDKEESEGVEVKKKLSEVLESLNGYITQANTFLRQQDELKKMSEQALKKVADVVNKAKENADDEKKKKIGETAPKLTNFIKKVSGLIVVVGKFIIKTTNAYYKELSKVVKQLKPKEKPADNVGGDESAQSGGDKNATAMFAFL